MARYVVRHCEPFRHSEPGFPSRKRRLAPAHSGASPTRASEPAGRGFGRERGVRGGSEAARPARCERAAGGRDGRKEQGGAHKVSCCPDASRVSVWLRCLPCGRRGDARMRRSKEAGRFRIRLCIMSCFASCQGSHSRLCAPLYDRIRKRICVLCHAFSAKMPRAAALSADGVVLASLPDVAQLLLRLLEA